MTLPEASDMLYFNGKGISGGSTWIDLGCGDGLFTKALAALLPEKSIVYAIDKNSSALNKIPDHFANNRLIKIHADFTDSNFPVAKTDGFLLANSLHYVKDKRMFLQKLQPYLTQESVLCIIEYDTDQPNQWVPYPVREKVLYDLFIDAGFSRSQFINRRPSIYNRANLYSVLFMK